MFKMGSGHHAGFEEGYCLESGQIGHLGPLPSIAGAGDAWIQGPRVNIHLFWAFLPQVLFLYNCDNCKVLLLSPRVHVSPSFPPHLRMDKWAWLC